MAVLLFTNLLVPTPIPRENPFFKSLKPYVDQSQTGGREHFSEVEEHEREKRRRRFILTTYITCRAQAIFSEQESQAVYFLKHFTKD